MSIRVYTIAVFEFDRNTKACRIPENYRRFAFLINIIGTSLQLLNLGDRRIENSSCIRSLFFSRKREYESTVYASLSHILNIVRNG